MHRFRLFMLFLACAIAFASPSAHGDTIEDNSMSELREDAERGDVKAQNILADAYYHGTGVVKNVPEAVNWWRRAADLGSGEAFSMLGTMSYLGTGVPQNSGEAVRLWKKGAELYDLNAQVQLGFAYMMGDSVPRNFIMAYMWFNIAVINGDKDAVKNRDSVAESLSADMIEEAQQLGTDWMQQHPKPAAPVITATPTMKKP